MFTLFFVLIFFVLMIPLGMAAMALLFKQTEGVGDPEWEIYRQRYD